MSASKDFLSSLPNIDQPAIATRPLRVAIATVDIAGPYHCGGIGSAYQGLAVALASAGHDVTVIYTHDGVRGPLSHWVDWYGQRGICFAHHPQAATLGPWYAGRKEASASCYEALRAEGPFDVIHFHEWLGLPYYSLVAKRLGLAFAETTLCVGTHGPLRWSRDGDGRLTSNRADLVVDFLERRSVALADVLVSPSRYLIDWMYDRDWEFPERRYVIPNVLLDVNGEIPVPPSSRERHDIRELVFFGRLDQRKGLPFFCDVMDRLAQSDDEALILEWANDPLVRQNAFVTDAIDLSTHRAWFRKRLHDQQHCRLFVVETDDGLPVGQVRFERSGESWEIHYGLDARFRGRGIGVPLLETALTAIKAENGGQNYEFFGRVNPENKASRKIFGKLGFSEESAGAELVYRQSNG